MRPIRPMSGGRGRVCDSQGHPPEEHAEIARALQAGAHDWAVQQLRDRLRGRGHADPTARPWARGPTGIRLHLRALERQRATQPQRDADPAGDADRPPHPRHGGDQPASSPARRSRGPRAARPGLHPDVDGCSRPWERWFERWPTWTRGRPCWTSNRAASHAGGPALDAALTVAADFIDLKSPFRPATAGDAPSSPPTRPGCTGPPSGDRDGLRRAALPRVRHNRDPEIDHGQRSFADTGEFDRVKLHPMLTEQMLARSSASPR